MVPPRSQPLAQPHRFERCSSRNCTVLRILLITSALDLMLQSPYFMQEPKELLLLSFERCTCWELRKKYYRDFLVLTGAVSSSRFCKHPWSPVRGRITNRCREHCSEEWKDVDEAMRLRVRLQFRIALGIRTCMWVVNDLRKQAEISCLLVVSLY
ncbi:hypothetical protein RB195_013097 [Necator americanus]|uniref:Uncharacterized protein n=1 Tax=Necator americanus TaxID=51031 RepID=A0ABR1DUG5_NECAM